MIQTIRTIFRDIEEKKKTIEFLPTGFRQLDTALSGGFLRKELVVLGGGTGIGKSYMSGQIFYNIARSGFLCAYFSLEISNSMVVSRLVGSQADIKSIKIVTGDLTDVEVQRKKSVETKMSVYEKNMAFYDDMYLYEDIEKEIREHEYEFVVIDFIQNVMLTGMDEYSRLSFIALSLQKLAKEMNCCILILSQLSNSVSRAPGAVEYKGSGSIATVCDLGFFIERGETLDGAVPSSELQLKLRKNRRGTSGLVFDYKFTGLGGHINES